MEQTAPPENRRVRFVHPAEEAFARILDFYGIEWEYEPRTFPLAWNRAGEVTLAFAPDFYLPEQDLYVELTTMRSRLSTIKNRKLRLMHERYPEINIKLFKRRELRDLMYKYGLERDAARVKGTGAQMKQTVSMGE
jgi:hypoxanthine phosphoribosyltransferase